MEGERGVTEDELDRLAQSLANFAITMVGDVPVAAGVLAQAQMLASMEYLPAEGVAQVMLESAEETYARIMAGQTGPHHDAANESERDRSPDD